MADDDKASDDDKPADGAEGEGAEGAEGGKKGLPIKKLLMIIVPVVLLLGGGAGAYFTGLLDGLLGKTAAAEGEEHAAADDGHGTKDDHGKKDDHAAKKKDDGHSRKKDDDHGGGHGDGHGGGGDGPTFLKVADEKGQDLVVNLNSPDGQMRFLQLGVQLELEDPSDADKVKAVMPRVIDQFQTYLRELRVKDLRGSAGIYRLQIELLARVNQAAAPVKIKNVLFEKILIQ
jgi:flagellar FliL protein